MRKLVILCMLIGILDFSSHAVLGVQNIGSTNSTQVQVAADVGPGPDAVVLLPKA